MATTRDDPPLGSGALRPLADLEARRALRLSQHAAAITRSTYYAAKTRPPRRVRPGTRRCWLARTNKRNLFRFSPPLKEI